MKGGRPQVWGWYGVEVPHEEVLKFATETIGKQAGGSTRRAWAMSGNELTRELALGLPPFVTLALDRGAVVRRIMDLRDPHDPASARRRVIVYQLQVPGEHGFVWIGHSSDWSGKENAS